jgi:hypothetical protein
MLPRHDEERNRPGIRRRLIAAQRAEQAAVHGIPLGYLAQLLRAFGGQDAVEGSGEMPPRRCRA